MILMNDFKSEPEALRVQTIEAVTQVLKSGWYVLGNEVKDFEKQWAKVCDTKHAVGVANGMDAIEIALRTLDIGPGDEVITTPMTAFATILAIYRAGAIPVLADISNDTGLMSIESVTRCLSKKTKAILLVHLYGQLRDMDVWQDLCKSNKIFLVEDCAQAHCSEWNGHPAGSLGSAGAFSFYPTKNLGTIGDGGMLVTNSDEIYNKAKILRNYGQSERYHHPEIGLNSRLDEVHAAILSVRLNWIEQFTDRRKEIANSYHSLISNSKITQLAEPQHQEAHVYHLFVLLCDQRDLLIEYLNENGIQALIHYPVPVHHQTPCHDIARDPHGLSITEDYAGKCLSLPCHPQMTNEDLKKVIHAVNSF
jgi:dTDP-4-amino-4,6-dideoxygalactose transaminase